MMEFYNLEEQSDYRIRITEPEKMEDLGDSFISKEEVKELAGPGFYNVGKGGCDILLMNSITAAVRKLTDKLDASGKKSVPIDDEPLLEVLKLKYFSDFTSGSSMYGRHGNKICYARRYTRKKVKATQSDVYKLWNTLQMGFKHKYGIYPSFIPRADRHVHMFKAFQKIVGWRRVRKYTGNAEQAKFFRQIWDNPEEFVR